VRSRYGRSGPVIAHDSDNEKHMHFPINTSRSRAPVAARSVSDAPVSAVMDTPSAAVGIEVKSMDFSAEDLAARLVFFAS
jgi:hypothetical protein